MVELAGRETAQRLQKQLIDTAVENSNGNAQPLHYRKTGQLALIYPDLDFDGASLYALNYLEWITQANWESVGGEMMPEIILGYASLSPQTESANAMMEIAENLVEMQKV